MQLDHLSGEYSSKGTPFAKTHAFWLENSLQLRNSMESQGIIRTVIFYKMIMFWYVSDFIGLPLSNLKSVLGLGICRWIT